MKDLQVHGGFECSIVRVGDGTVQRNQLFETGHDANDKVFKLISRELGLSHIRYPIPWEIVTCDSPNPENWNWTWADKKLELIREAGLTITATLGHHGSGPYYTSLQDPKYSEYMQIYAQHVANRYPDINSFTINNEPLTNARFTTWDTIWYSPERGNVPFVRALFNQIFAIVDGIAAIKSIKPDAEFVQTEDMGVTLSTPKLQYQADFQEAAKRWSLDLLIFPEKFGNNHSLWGYAKYAGMKEEELSQLQFKLYEKASKYNIKLDKIGVNTYVTSQRFLDDDIEKYPIHMHGTNDEDVYVDTEVVRVVKNGLIDPDKIFYDVWKRYQVPIRITEVHLGCREKEEQARWFMRMYKAANDARKLGADIDAITAWAIDGLVDWDTRLSVVDNHYESGVFSRKRGKLVSNKYTKVVEAIAKTGECDFPFLLKTGWWERENRYKYNKVTVDSDYYSDS